MTYEEYQERYEAEAQEEVRRLSALPLAELLDRLRRRELGSHYQLWHAIAGKNDVSGTAGVLFAELKSGLQYLDRYACAEALLSMLPYAGLRAIDVSDRRRPTYDMYLAELEVAVTLAVNRDVGGEGEGRLTRR